MAEPNGDSADPRRRAPGVIARRVDRLKQLGRIAADGFQQGLSDGSADPDTADSDPASLTAPALIGRVQQLDEVALVNLPAEMEPLLRDADDAIDSAELDEVSANQVALWRDTLRDHLYRSTSPHPRQIELAATELMKLLAPSADAVRAMRRSLEDATVDQGTALLAMLNIAEGVNDLVDDPQGTANVPALTRLSQQIASLERRVDDLLARQATAEQLLAGGLFAKVRWFLRFVASSAAGGSIGNGVYAHLPSIISAVRAILLRLYRMLS